MTRPWGAAPEHMYVPSYCTLADLQRVVPECIQDVDPGGVGYIGGLSALTRTSIYVSQAVVNRLHLERLRQRMSQHTVANAIGMSDMAISQWERGLIRMTIYTAVEIADVLGVDLDARWDDQAAD